MRVIPDESTRLAALKGGEVDIAYSIRGTLAEEVQHTPGLKLNPVYPPAPFWIYFPDQWDPKSPWHDIRVRQAASLALDRDGMNKALFLGFCKTTNSIIPASFEYFWQPPAAAPRRGQGQAAAGRCRSSERVRRRSLLLRQLLREYRRGRGQQSRADRHQPVAAAARTRRVRRRLFRKEIPQRRHPRGKRRIRQRGDPARRLCHQGWRLCLWQLSRYRRAVSGAGGRTRPQEARRHPREDTAAGLRKAIYAPIWQLAFLNGDRAAGR